jgi:hypothetical protein
MKSHFLGGIESKFSIILFETLGKEEAVNELYICTSKNLWIPVVYRYAILLD